VKGKGHEREVDVCTCMEDGDDGMQSEVKWQCRFAVNNSDNRNKGESEQKGSINKYMVKRRDQKQTKPLVTFFTFLFKNWPHAVSTSSQSTIINFSP